MIINFVGNFQSGPGGEPADEAHIARCMEELGHTVRRIPRDEWREYVRTEDLAEKEQYKNVPKDMRADLNIIAKWHHFYDGSFIKYLRALSDAPVFYWVWDSCDLGIEWHKKMAQAADLYLSGELGRARGFREEGISFYYFQFDCVDGDMPLFREKKKYNVVYLGSCDNQNGRIDVLKEINKQVPITVFGHDFVTWREQGFTASPAVYGVQANEVIAQAKIVLGTSCDPHLYGYWSNRVGRVLYAGGRLLQQYTPGMENFLPDFVEYFSSPAEAIEKINKILDPQNYYIHEVQVDRNQWTSKDKVKKLMIMAERYLKEDYGKNWLLP